MIIAIVLIALGFLAITASSIYNNVISKKNQIDNAEGAVNSILKKRHELIPNLTACVQFDYEQQQLRLDKLQEITKAISSGDLNPQRMEQESQIAQLSSAMLAAVSDPNTESVIHLQKTWTEIEEQISAARRFYNTAVAQYNTTIESFPGNLVANYLKLERRKKYDIPLGQKFSTRTQLGK